MAIFSGSGLPYVPPGAPASQQIAAINRIIDRLNDMLNQMVLADGSSRRMLIGYQKDGWGSGKDFGIKISREGVDVLEATDSQLLFKMDIETWTWFAQSGGKYLQLGKLGDNRVGIDLFNVTDGKNIGRLGQLPDDSFNVIFMKQGFNVSEAF